ncbi:hypothetical protein UPYG_G00239970 [Umbra pygmaea]|uniref:Uncharacterized protein n=1 Tax=Umbra pygmaea TaxID=75934 RepID=A0ABD0WK46_UMBPY
MPCKLRCHSKFLLVCLVVIALNVSFLHSSSARSRKTEQQGRISQGTDGSRKWRALYNSYTPRLNLRKSQSSSTHLRHGHQSIPILRPEAQSVANKIVVKQREGPPDGHELLPLNSSQQLGTTLTEINLTHIPGNVHSSKGDYVMSPQEGNELTTLTNKIPIGTQESKQLYIQEMNTMRAVKAVPAPRASQPFIAPPVFDQSGGLSSSSEPVMAVHYLKTYPWSGLGSPIVQRTFGAAGNTQSVKKSLIQSGKVTSSILEPGGNNLGSSVAERIDVHIQRSENPLSDEDTRYRKARYEGIREGVKTRNTFVVSSPTQHEVDPSVYESGTSTHIKGDYGYTGSRLYPKSFTSDNRQQAPVQPRTLTLAASSDGYAPTVSRPLYHSANFAKIGSSPRSHSSSEMVGRRASNRVHPSSRFGFLQNAETLPTLSLPTKRETAFHALEPDQSLKNKRIPVPMWNKPGLQSSSTVRNREDTGRYKMGKSKNINTLFGFKGFQYQALKNLASSVSEEHHPAVEVRNSINRKTEKSQSTGWREGHGTPRGMKMGSVSGYPPVFKKYGFVSSAPTTFISETQEVQPMSTQDNLASRNIESAHYHSKVQPDTEVGNFDSDFVDHSVDAVSPRQLKDFKSVSAYRGLNVHAHRSTSLQKDGSQTGTKPSSPSTIQQSSDNSVLRRLNPLSNIRSSEVKRTNATPRSTQQVRGPYRHVFKGFNQAPSQPTFPQRQSRNNIQPISGPPSNVRHIGSSTGAILDPITLSLFKLQAKYKNIGFGNQSTLDVKLAGDAWPSASLVESAHPEIQTISVTRKATQYQSFDSDASHKTKDRESGYDNKSNLQNLDKITSKHFNHESGVLPKISNRYANMSFQIVLENNAGTTKDKVAALSPQEETYSTPSFSEVPPFSRPEGENRGHPTLDVSTYASSVHPDPARVQLDPSPTGLASSRNPTRSVKHVKGPNPLPFSFSLSPSNDTAPPYILRSGEVSTDRFKAIQFADIQGSASFSGVPLRAVSRLAVQTTAKTTAWGQDGYALERRVQTTAMNFTTSLGQE